MNKERMSNSLPAQERWAEGFELNAKAMRDAGRWVIGVVAGILLAATNLSGFGRLYPDQWRFWLAAVSAVVSVASIGKIVHLFLHIQINEEMDWEKLTPSQLTFVQEYGFLLKYSTFAEFLNHQLKTLAEYATVRSSIGATPLVFSPQHNHDLLNRQKILSDELTDMAWERLNIEALLGWRPVKQRFDRARHVLLWLGAIAAIATMALVWAVNGPEPRSEMLVVLPPSASPQATR
jgi:hypothetical protein